ncbi:MAG TPA: protein kinase [Vicinamibacterales bacterium]|nr:protein kinase [Vicinamibacterales bacterium]
MDPVSPDARLSNYQLDRLLGSGGMGSVYLARDLALDRVVAIKFISPDKAADPSARRRLIREARAAAALDHPNICTIYEVIDDPAGQACIVMQYVEGETLADTLRPAPLDVRFALSLAADLAAALSAAHKRGVVHRDLKPQNVIVTPERRAKLLDFGIARYSGPSAVSGEAVTGTHLTLTGGLPGTPAYMSPEQVQGRPVDGRSDLFALGAVLYECLTGQRAFKGRNSLELAAEIVTHDPPPASSLRPELNEQHDELCRRLLAKRPEDRFNSADELLGALRVLGADTGRSEWSHHSTGAPASTLRRRLSRPRVLAAAASVAVLALLGVWQWRASTVRLDPQAADWYRRGTEAIRDGAPHSARLALNEAIKAAPDYAPAHIRLAEAETELDEVDSAQQSLLRATGLMSESRLPYEDRKRVEAIRALMLRDVDGAVRAYGDLASRNPDDPGVWLDLGRVQDTSARTSEARLSYEKALQIDDQYAPAHLGRASILASEGRRDEALKAFDEAERLYRAGSNVEGEVETLIRRGAFLNGLGKLSEARQALDRAKELAGNLRSRAQLIRGQLTLSTVTASNGNFEEAERMAVDAVDAALRAELESVAAGGLVDLAIVLFLRKKSSEADALLVRAIELARKRGAETIIARATLQRAAIMLDSGREAEGIAAARGPLDYFQANRYRRYELSALSLMARAHEALGDYAEAQALAQQALRTATEIKDEAQVAEALENLAGQANAVGNLPEALEYRASGLEIHRRQGDFSKLGFDLVNRADLLIRVGRHSEGAQLLDEIDAGITKELDAYVPRARRANTFRLMSAAIQHNQSDVRRHAGALVQSPNDKPDFSARLADVLLGYADTLGGRPLTRARSKGPLAGSLSSPVSRELRYWDLARRLAEDDARGALSGVEETLADKAAAISYEFEWRIAAIGAAAARRLNEADRETAFYARAKRAIDRLRREWKSEVSSYEKRADLVELRRKAGLN